MATSAERNRGGRRERQRRGNSGEDNIQYIGGEGCRGRRRRLCASVVYPPLLSRGTRGGYLAARHGRGG